MIEFNNTYTNLPPEFYQRVKAEDFPNPTLIAFNEELALELGLNIKLNDDSLAHLFSGQDKSIDSIAMVYAGHQFGHFNPRLGDGRALLLGEVVTPKGQRFDIQLKGSGPTKYSRNGDGRSAIGPVVREYLVSEAMFHLGIPTTRALCAVATNETVYRETPLPGAILTRVASSHIRIGTFEYFAGIEDYASLKILADYAIDRHYPKTKDSQKPYFALLEACAKNWSNLIAQWMRVGFIHGVMNTDNMSICGQTIDYGPCAFMDHFKFDKVFSYIDRRGRYSYQNQINIGKWNLSRFASALLPLLGKTEEVQEFLERLYPLYDQAWLSVMTSKLGLIETNREQILDFLSFLESNRLDFTNAFYDLTVAPDSLTQYEGFKDWSKKWSSPNIEKMKLANPKIIPRNHHIQKAIELAESGDYSYLKFLHESYKHPYSSAVEELRVPPQAHEVVTTTFCGT